MGKEKFELGSGNMIFAAADEMRGIKSLEQLVLLAIHDPHV